MVDHDSLKMLAVQLHEVQSRLLFMGHLPCQLFINLPVSGFQSDVKRALQAHAH